MKLTYSSLYLQSQIYNIEIFHISQCSGYLGVCFLQTGWSYRLLICSFSNFNNFPYSLFLLCFILEFSPKIDLPLYLFEYFLPYISGSISLLATYIYWCFFWLSEFPIWVCLYMHVYVLVYVYMCLCLFWLPLHTVLNRNTFWSFNSYLLWIFFLDLFWL